MTDLETQSIRAKILQAIGDRCQSLLVKLPSGKWADAQVFWGRQSLDPEELPAGVVTPEPETGERTFDSDELTMPVTISLACLLGNDNAVDLAESLLAELRRQVPLDDETLDGLAKEIRYVGGGTSDYPERDDQSLVVTATFEIDYATAANNPEESI